MGKLGKEWIFRVFLAWKNELQQNFKVIHYETFE